MKYLVTGGAGFIGSNFIHYLFRKYPDCHIINLDKLTYAGNRLNLSEFEGQPNYEFVQGDICNRELVDQLVGLCDVMVHFAAESHVDRSVLAPEQFVKTNVLGTFTLLEAARRHGGKRMHHCSTDECMGSLPIDSDEKWTEQSPVNPRSPYSASKAASDHLARSYFITYGLPVTISNCANNIGPYMYPEKLFPLAITNLIEGKKVPVYGTGRQIREWLYVDDHCQALDLILGKGRLGETYFIGPEEGISNLEAVKQILAELDLKEERIEFVKDRPGHDSRYSLDTTKIKTELGFRLKYSFKQALQKTVEWYKNNQDWWRPIKNSEAFQNYYSRQYSLSRK
jgi:dTDP-glucose 4,6-dehydratase